MTGRHAERWCCAWLLLLAACLPRPAAALETTRVDARDSAVGFVLRTRWGQRLEGRIPVLAGEVRPVGAGLRQVRLRLSARDVEIVGYPRYTQLTRDEAFFDADRHPEVSFVSDPFGPELVRTGGALVGVLQLRGVERRETFHVEPAPCERPMLDCAVVAAGVVSRGDYAMDRWSFALGERVQFRLSLRGTEAATP